MKTDRISSKNGSWSHKAGFTALCLVFLVGVCGCTELFGLDEPIPISVPEFSQPFTLNLGDLVQGMDLPDEAQGEQEMNVDWNLGQDVTLTDIEPKLAKYQGRVDSVVIDYIQYDFTTNTLTQDLGPLSLYFGEVGKRSPGTGVAKYGQTGRIVNLTPTNGPVAMIEAPAPEGKAAVGQYLGNFDFSTIMELNTIYVDPEKDISGAIQGEMKIKLTIKVKPL